jgi:biopolymer transport protein ExbB
VDIVRTFSDLALLGSAWVLWLLLILSILSIAVIIERAVFYARSRVDFDAFREQLMAKLQQKDWNGAKQLCSNQPSIECQAVLYALDTNEKSVEALDQRVTSFLMTERQVLDRGLVILGTLGNNAPFIGLFGTVIGIIVAFKDLSMNTSAGASVVMEGISEALVATAVGLLVAIPAVIAYNTFQRIVKRRLSNAEAAVKLVTAEIISGS